MKAVATEIAVQLSGRASAHALIIEQFDYLLA